MDDVYLQKVLDGHVEEFRYFIRTYQDFAYSIALSIVKQEVFAQEVVQSSFINAFTSLGKFDKRSKFSSWLYKIVINCAYKYLQRNKLLVDEKDSESVIPVEIIDETIEQADLEEKQFIVNQALQRVSADSALALTLFYMQEYSIKEVCELTGWTESKTKVTLHRARHNMKKAICEVKITYKIEA